MPTPAAHARAIRGVSLACCAAALLGTAPSHASDAARKAVKQPAHKPLLLSREELRACMNTKSDIDRRKGELEQQQAQLHTEKDELVRLGSELKERLATMDRTNKELVEKYVADNNDREKRIDALEAGSKAYEERARSLEATRTAYQKDCASKRYDEDDERAIKAGK